MKKTICAVVSALAGAAFSGVVSTAGFEASEGYSVGSGVGDVWMVGSGDASLVMPYGDAAKPSQLTRGFTSAGENFLELDSAGGVWRPIAETSGDIFFDADVQLCAFREGDVPEIPEGAKFVFWLSTTATATNLWIKGNPTDFQITNAGTLVPDSWHRFTVKAENAADGFSFTVFLDGTRLVAGERDVFPSLTSDTPIQSIGFTGSGALDNLVARTDDPFAQLFNGGSGTAEDPYLISSVAALNELSVFATNDVTAGVYFRQTTDIALTDTFGGIGLPDAKDGIATADFKAHAFRGVYDGGNHLVSGVTLRAGGDYIGFFNSCCGATVRNLRLAIGGVNGWSDGTTTGSVGGVLAGVSADTLFENCTTVVVGENDTFEATKTAGGLLGYASYGTILRNCTNTLNVVSVGNEKAAGLVACVQRGKSDGVEYTSLTGATTVEVDNCANLGNVTCKLSGKARTSGLLCYVDLGVIFKGANTFTGTLTQVGGTAVQSVANVASGGKLTLTDGATFTVPAAYKTANAGTVDGLFFATVNGETATLVRNAAAVAGANLKVMAANAPAIVLANVGDAITLDETLATVGEVKTAAANAEVRHSGNVYTVVSTAATFPSDWNGGATPSPEMVQKFTTWATENKVDASSATAAQELAFLMNVAPADNLQLEVTAITLVDGKVILSTNTANPNGVVYVISGSTPTTLTNTATDLTNLPATLPQQFYKVCLGYAQPEE